MVTMYGFTIRCHGCTAISRGTAKQPHNENCRQRIEAKLREDGNSNLQRADEIISEQIAEKIERSQGSKRERSEEGQIEETKFMKIEEETRDQTISDDQTIVDQAISQQIDDQTIVDQDNLMTGIKEDEKKDLQDAVMAITADEQIAEWMVKGSISGINSKEEERTIVTKALSNYCPGIESHIIEIYSPPRVTTMAERFKLIPGLALDLTTIDPDDGMPWNFDDPSKRAKAKQLVHTRRSLLVIGSPMCSAFSQLQQLNFPKMSKQEIERMINYGRKHL